jgi:hypothetical protein
LVPAWARPVTSLDAILKPPNCKRTTDMAPANTFLLQEMMNFWKQTSHVMSYFPEENFRGHERLPKNFMNAFLEASSHVLPARIQGKAVTTNTSLQGRN